MCPARFHSSKTIQVGRYVLLSFLGANCAGIEANFDVSKLAPSTLLPMTIGLKWRMWAILPVYARPSWTAMLSMLKPGLPRRA